MNTILPKKGRKSHPKDVRSSPYFQEGVWRVSDGFEKSAKGAKSAKSVKCAKHAERAQNSKCAKSA